MAKLKDAHRDLLKLIERSPVGVDGWRSVSQACCSLFTRPDFPSSSIPSELFVFEKLTEGGRVKLTERGEILLAYI